jgi:hypothetical protein
VPAERAAFASRKRDEVSGLKLVLKHLLLAKLAILYVAVVALLLLWWLRVVKPKRWI